MSFLLAIFLGIVQGLTEFLPVSSSGHLVLLQKFFGIGSPIFFDTMVHIGTLGAVLLFFGKELTRVSRVERVLRNIVVGTAPVVLVGFLVQPFVKVIFGNLFLVGMGFLVTGALLLWSKKLSSGQKGLEGIKGLKDFQAFTIGIFQAAALVPGISRSGATIVGGLSQKLDRESAFRFSLYLSIPAVIGANILQLKDLSQINFLSESLAGMVAAFVVGYVSLNILQKVLRGGKLYLFSFYCFMVGLISLGGLLFGGR